MKLTTQIEGKWPGRTIAVLIPELVKDRWYQHLLHTHRAQRLRSRLLKHGSPRVTIINIPWHLTAPRRK